MDHYKQTLPRPEYPRPQFVRREWLNLNGEWEFAFDDANKGRDLGWHFGLPLNKRIIVPFPYQSEASGINDKSVHENVWYARDFEVPADWRGQNVLLHFGAVDYRAIVWINGKEVGHNQGGHVPFQFNISPFLTMGTNRLTVRVEDRQNPRQPRGKQSTTGRPHDIDYYCTTGIWQTVWMEPVPAIRIEKIKIDTSARGGLIGINVDLHAPASRWRLEIEALEAGSIVARTEERINAATARLRLRIPDAASSVNANHVRDTCGQCHANVNLSRRFGLPPDRVTTYDESFHGLAQKGGSQVVASCASCHGIHNILPSKDPKSMINAKNLPTTCGKCHPGAGKRFALGSIHAGEGKREPYAVAMVRMFYLLVIPLTIGLMVLHNLGDWLRKLLARRFIAQPVAPQSASIHGAMRMYPYERLSHALLVLSFFVLAWTGFALKFPDAWWARPLAIVPEFRRNVHRGAAIVFLVVSVMHVISLLANRKLRDHWRVFLPRWRDVPDAMKMMMFNLGLSKSRPAIPSHSYVEKAEYWAVLWGGFVMFVTGALLWANSFSLRFLPKSVLDVCTAVHWYEAILATLAIVVWHIYSVVLDPDVYPLDTAFLTGRSVRPHPEEEGHPAPVN